MGAHLASKRQSSRTNELLLAEAKLAVPRVRPRMIDRPRIFSGLAGEGGQR